jgi:hypothetical protein
LFHVNKVAAWTTGSPVPHAITADAKKALEGATKKRRTTLKRDMGGGGVFARKKYTLGQATKPTVLRFLKKGTTPGT